jgi:hypothetical protein
LTTFENLNRKNKIKQEDEKENRALIIIQKNYKKIRSEKSEIINKQEATEIN